MSTQSPAKREILHLSGLLHHSSNLYLASPQREGERLTSTAILDHSSTPSTSFVLEKPESNAVVSSASSPEEEVDEDDDDSFDDTYTLKDASGLYVTNRDAALTATYSSSTCLWRILSNSYLQSLSTHAYLTYASHTNTISFTSSPSPSFSQFIFCPPRYESWLKKLSHGVLLHQWQRRYFVFEGGKLKYYHNVPTYEGKLEKEKPVEFQWSEIVGLTGTPASNRFSIQIGGEQHLQQLQSGSPAGVQRRSSIQTNTIELEAETPEIAQAWQRILVRRDEIAHCDYVHSPDERFSINSAAVQSRSAQAPSPLPPSRRGSSDEGKEKALADDKLLLSNDNKVSKDSSPHLSRGNSFEKPVSFMTNIDDDGNMIEGSENGRTDKEKETVWNMRDTDRLQPATTLLYHISIDSPNATRTGFNGDAKASPQEKQEKLYSPSDSVERLVFHPEQSPLATAMMAAKEQEQRRLENEKQKHKIQVPSRIDSDADLVSPTTLEIDRLVFHPEASPLKAAIRAIQEKEALHNPSSAVPSESSEKSTLQAKHDIVAEREQHYKEEEAFARQNHEEEMKHKLAFDRETQMHDQMTSQIQNGPSDNAHAAHKDMDQEEFNRVRANSNEHLAKAQQEYEQQLAEETKRQTDRLEEEKRRMKEEDEKKQQAHPKTRQELIEEERQAHLIAQHEQFAARRRVAQERKARMAEAERRKSVDAAFANEMNVHQQLQQERADAVEKVEEEKQRQGEMRV